MSDGLEASELLSETESKIVHARGTEEGLVLRIDGRADWSHILQDVEAYLCRRKGFFEGGMVSVEWLDRLPTKDQSAELELLLRDKYSIAIAPKKGPKQFTKTVEATKEVKPKVKTIPLFQQVTPEKVNLRDNLHFENLRNAEQFEHDDRDGVEVTCSSGGSNVSLGELGSGKTYLDKVLGEDVFYDEDANAKILFGTLRSGQRMETPFSLIIVGDVNPGADLIAGGDIVVLGSLRGTAHASAYDDDAPDRVIIALNMQPIQLRIGSVISRGSDEAGKGAEIARIEDRRIVVEVFQPRLAAPRRLR